MQNFATPGPVSVVLEIPAGAVRLVATERTDTVVDVQPADASKKRDVTAAESHRVLGGSGALHVTIELPVGSRLDGKAGAAELHTTGRLGDVAFDGGYTVVSIEEAAGAVLKVHTGDVAINCLTGSAQIR